MFNPQNLNRFSYVGSNPINFNDPTGHCGSSITITGIMNGTSGTGGVCLGQIDGSNLSGKLNGLVINSGSSVTVSSSSPNVSTTNTNNQSTSGSTNPFAGASAGSGSVNSNQNTSLPDLLHSFDYNIPPTPITLHQFSSPFYDFRILWTPSLTFHNNSNVMISPNGFRIRSINVGPIRSITTLNKDSFQFGYTSSISDNINNMLYSNGVSLSIPDLPQPWTARINLHQTTEIDKTLSYNHVLSVEFTARPDRMTLIALPATVYVAYYYVTCSEKCDQVK